MLDEVKPSIGQGRWNWLIKPRGLADFGMMFCVAKPLIRLQGIPLISRKVVAMSGAGYSVTSSVAVCVVATFAIVLK